MKIIPHTKEQAFGLRIAAVDLDHILLHTRELWEEVRGQRIFLTGGTGFFGCWLLESFLWANDRLQLDARIDVLTRDPDRFRQKAPHLAEHPVITLITGDIRTFAFPEGQFSHIIHAATEASVTLNRDEPDLMRRTIIEGTDRVLTFADHCGAQKLLLTSSGAVYGRQPPTITHMPEDKEAVDKPLATPSAYAEGKREAERLWTEKHEGQTRAIARCFAFVGPHLPLDGAFAIGNFIRDGMRGGPIRVNGDGTPERSYLYAADLVIWLWTILFRGEHGRPYNVGSERNLSISDIAKIVAEQCSPTPAITITQTPTLGKEPERYVPSTNRARSELGLQEWIPLESAVKRTIAWYALEPLRPRP